MFTDAFSQNSTISSLEIGIRGLMQRHEILTGNISNAGTPNYLAKHLKFEENLASIQKKLRYGTELDLTNTAKEHFNLTPNTALEARIEITESNRDFITNGNNVDLDREMLNLGKTGMKYKAVANLGKRFFEHIQTIIRG